MASRLLTDCVPELQEKYPAIKKDYEAKFPNTEVRIICSLRSTEEQNILWKQGRETPGNIVTWIDGITKIGAHNPIPGQVPLARALDVGVFVKGKYMINSSYYTFFKELAKKYNLKSGWDFGDPPHLEIRTGAVIRTKKQIL